MAHGAPTGNSGCHDLGITNVRAGDIHMVERGERAASRPHTGSEPWERITKLQAVRHLFKEAGIEDVEVVAENGRQELRSPDDWWTIVLGSGFRWTVEQLGPDEAERVRHNNLDQIRRRKIESVETNAIFARARKRE